MCQINCFSEFFHLISRVFITSSSVKMNFDHCHKLTSSVKVHLDYWKNAHCEFNAGVKSVKLNQIILKRSDH